MEKPAIYRVTVRGRLDSQWSGGLEDLNRTEEELLIDIDLLGPGRYQLVVTVRDRHSGELSASNVVFEKVPGAARASRGAKD